MSKRIFKAPRTNSGNVSISHQDLTDLTDGTAHLVVKFPDGRVQPITLEDWMFGSARDMGDYVLLPISENSRLARPDQED